MSRVCLCFFLSSAVLLALTTGCAPALVPAAPASVAPTAAATALPAQTVHAVAIRVTGGTAQLMPGTTTQLELGFEPIIRSVTLRADGSRLSVSQEPWPDPDVAQMRYCVSLRAACAPAEVWLPFSSSVRFPVPVDWLGTRSLWVTAEFRDSGGNPILGIDENQNSAPRARANVRLSSSVNLNTPADLQPPAVQTLLAPTRLASPVQGSVTIADGRCCVGGKAGSSVEIPVTFRAESRAGPVTEMRVANTCPNEGQGLKSDWEPFVAEKTYTTTAALNWVGWYIAVQYRDAGGNVSGVYCDDVSVEGMP